MRYERTLLVNGVANDPTKVAHYNRLITASRTSATVRIQHRAEEVPAQTVLDDIETHFAKARAEDETRAEVLGSVRDYIAGLGRVSHEIPYGGTERQLFIPMEHIADPLTGGI